MRPILPTCVRADDRGCAVSGHAHDDVSLVVPEAWPSSNAEATITWSIRRGEARCCSGRRVASRSDPDLAWLRHFDGVLEPAAGSEHDFQAAGVMLGRVRVIERDVVGFPTSNTLLSWPPYVRRSDAQTLERLGS